MSAQCNSIMLNSLRVLKYFTRNQWPQPAMSAGKPILASHAISQIKESELQFLDADILCVSFNVDVSSCKGQLRSSTFPQASRNVSGVPDDSGDDD